MNKVSVAFNISFSAPFDRAAYLPLLLELGEHLENCYCQGFARGYKPNEEPIEKMSTTKIPSRVKRYIFDNLCKVLKIPLETSYFWQCKLFDYLVARKLKNDSSDVLILHGNMRRSIDIAKKMGKKIVVLADMSEPKRQYKEYVKEKKEFNIGAYNSYGDSKFMELYNDSLMRADYIVTISNLSNKTYIDAGYSPDKLKMIPLMNSSFTCRNDSIKRDKKRAFICTANHSLLKGTHRLLSAWKKAKISDVPLIIIGRIYADMKEYINKYGPFENVIFEGFRNDLEEYYDSYDAVGILLSFSEAAVRTTAEMIKKGFPMIVSPDATCDLVKNGYNGFIVNPRNEEGIVSKLRWFNENWIRTIEMRPHVLASVKEETIENYGRNIAKFLISL